MSSLTPNETITPQQPQTPPTKPPLPTSAPYTFPHQKLKRRLTHPNKTPLVLVSCGSFSPLTFLHLQMFELAERYAADAGFEVVGNYLSPVSDAYRKRDLAPAHHRLRMCELAVEATTNIMVDPWEAIRCSDEPPHEPVYTRTVDVLRHFDYEINDVLGGIIQAPEGPNLDDTGVHTPQRARARITLLLGADVAKTMGDPKIWAPADLDQILGVYGAFIVERPAQTSIQQALDGLKQYEDTIWVVKSFQNDVSSTRIREQIRNGETVVDVPEVVLGYIRLNGLYRGIAPLPPPPL